MKKGLPLGLLFLSVIISLGAREADNQGDIMTFLLNNQYLTESLRLLELAEEYYDTGDYDTSIRYAEEAVRYSQMSDNFVTLQLRIREVDGALAAAEDRILWAEEELAPERYAEAFMEAQSFYEEAQVARDNEEWDSAYDSAVRVLDVLAVVSELTRLPSHYLVRTWQVERDCLWNIAKEPLVYGDPLKWTILYEANKHILSQPYNPDLIHPEQIIYIPSINGERRSGMLDRGVVIPNTSALR